LIARDNEPIVDTDDKRQQYGFIKASGRDRVTVGGLGVHRCIGAAVFRPQIPGPGANAIGRGLPGRRNGG